MYEYQRGKVCFEGRRQKFRGIGIVYTLLIPTDRIDNSENLV